MTIVSHNLETEPLDEGFALLEVGAEQSGKSRLAATAPPEVLFFDFDLKAATLRGRKGVWALTFQDNPDTSKLPNAFNEADIVASALEKSRRLCDIHESFKTVDPSRVVKTVVLDSIGTISTAARKYVLASNNELSYTITIAGAQGMGARFYRVPKNWHGWGGEQALVEQLIMKLRSIPSLNVIVTLHECMEEAENSSEENPIFTGKVEVYPRRYNSIIKFFPEVWRLTRQAAGEPVVQVQPDGKFTKCGTTLSLPTGTKMPANISSILAIAKNGNRG